MTVLDVFIVNVGLPTIERYYHTTNASVQLVVAAYLVGYSVFLITGSRLGDHFGRKRLFCIGLLLFTVTSVCCGYAGTIGELASLFLFSPGGVGFSGGTPDQLPLIQSLPFRIPGTRTRQLRVLWNVSGCRFTGAVPGRLPPIDSHLIRDSWRLIFLINLPIGLLASLLSDVFSQKSPKIRSSGSST